MDIRQIVIVGAGHAGVQAAASLRDEGYEGRLILIDRQPVLPYQRPPLSKAYMKGEATAESLVLRGAAFYEDKRIDLMLGRGVKSIEPGARTITLEGDQVLPYDRLILAQGARSRPLPFPVDSPNSVLALRDMNDAERLKAGLAKARRVVILGAGFIGLEVAAVAARMGKAVTVIEPMPRVMARAVSPILSDAFAAYHRGLGVTLALNTGVVAIETETDGQSSVLTTEGQRMTADLVLAGIGVMADDSLAGHAGLTVGNGVVVDERMQTTDPAVYAIGDMTQHPNAFFGGPLRLESVQNALDQAKVAAKAIMGKTVAYRSVPWFWSDQADWKLQIAGVSPALDQHVLRGEVASGSFSVFGYREGALSVVESVNRPADHMLARKLLESGRSIPPDQVGDPSFDLRAALSR